MNTKNFNAVQLQTYSPAQVEFIASVEDGYDNLAELTADYADELAALADTE